MGNKNKRRREEERELEAAAEPEPLLLAVPPHAKYYCERHDHFFRLPSSAEKEMKTSLHGPISSTHPCPRCFKRFQRKEDLNRHKSQLGGTHTFPLPWRQVPWDPDLPATWRAAGFRDDDITPFEEYYSAPGQGGNAQLRVLVVRLEVGVDVASVIPRPGRMA